MRGRENKSQFRKAIGELTTMVSAKILIPPGWGAEKAQKWARRKKLLLVATARVCVFKHFWQVVTFLFLQIIGRRQPNRSIELLRIFLYVKFIAQDVHKYPVYNYALRNVPISSMNKLLVAC